MQRTVLPALIGLLAIGPARAVGATGPLGATGGLSASGHGQQGGRCPPYTYTRAQSTPEPAELPQAEPVLDEEFRLPVDDRMTAGIDSMISLLGSPDYQQRVAAAEGLIQIGAPAFAKLRTAYHQTNDLEVRLRVERVVHRSYLDHHVYLQHAFLGISLIAYTPRADAKPMLPEGTTGIEVTQVIKDTGAQRAGLRKGDVIVAADHVPLKGHGTALVQSFSRGISVRKPGMRMTLTIVRPDGEHDIDVTLGRCPESLARQGRVRAVYDALQEASERFDIWWAQYFRGLRPPVTGGKEP